MKDLKSVISAIVVLVSLIASIIQLYQFAFAPVDTGTAILATIPCASVAIVLAAVLFFFALRSRPQVTIVSNQEERQRSNLADTDSKSNDTPTKTRSSRTIYWITSAIVAFVYNVGSLFVLVSMLNNEGDQVEITGKAFFLLLIGYAIMAYIGLWLGGKAPNRSAAWKWGAGTIYGIGAIVLLLLSGNWGIALLGPLMIAPCGLIGGWLGGWLKDSVGIA